MLHFAPDLEFLTLLQVRYIVDFCYTCVLVCSVYMHRLCTDPCVYPISVTSVLLNIEHRLMLHFAPDLEFLTLLQVRSSYSCVYVTRVAAPSPRASLGRRTVCGRTEQLSAAGFEALRN